MRFHKKKMLILLNLAIFIYIFWTGFWKLRSDLCIKIKNEEYLEKLFSRKFEDEAKKLYLNDKYLKLIHSAYDKIDSKSVVDRPTKKPLDQVLKALNDLDENDLHGIRLFVDEFLHEPGYEIVIANFSDWRASPKYIDAIKDENLKNFSLALHHIWQDLYKQMDTEKLIEGAVSSHLPIKNPFVVPGGRFLGIIFYSVTVMH